MIFFVVPAEDSFEIREYLQDDGSSLRGKIRLVSYQEMGIRGSLPLGSYVFCALDQLSPTERRVAVRCWEALAQANCEITLVNHPAEVMCRFELLDMLFRLQQNSFRAFRASEFARCARFPVFIRAEREHSGSLSGLLHNRRQLAQALARAVLKGWSTHELLIVEYCHTANPQGVFRKYSAYVVGERIVPNSIVHSNQWVTKWSSKACEPEWLREELEYVETNPHEAWLRSIFSLAHIRYGRIDYGMKGSAPQVWEINTNPTISRLLEQRGTGDFEQRRKQRELRAAVRQRFHGQLCAALSALHSAAEPSTAVTVKISPNEREQMESERRAQRLARRRRVLFGRGAAFAVRVWRNSRRQAPEAAP